MDRKIIELFNQLHENPECSGKEKKTVRIIRNFMEQNMGFECHELAGGFYYVYRGRKPQFNIAIRADYDAVSIEGDIAGHLCGHDGHSASLCALALKLMEEGSDNDVYLLFQSSEENGKGAKDCLGLFNEKIDMIFGQHNLPGFEFGKVYCTRSTFACTSEGLIIRLKGKSSHAAYPELGLSPSAAVSKILDLSQKYKTIDKMVTPISVKMGQKSFGVMAHEAEVCLTLRSDNDASLNQLRNEIIQIVEKNKGDIISSYEEVDYFPATVNHEHAYTYLKNRLNVQELKEPMRWSEDFGYYLRENEGAFFGIGAGIGHAGLHTAEYTYPIELVDITADCFYNLVK